MPLPELSTPRTGRGDRAGQAPGPWASWAVAVVAALVAGWLFGWGMSRVQLSPSWGWVRELAAPWAVLAFVAGCATRVAAASAVAGWLSVTVAVVSFYGLWSVPPQAWPQAGPWPAVLLVAAAVGGPALGWLGALWRQRQRYGVVAAGGAGGLLVAEGVVLALRPPTAAVPATAFLLEAAAGLLLVAALVRAPRDLARALGVVAGVALAGIAAEATTGIVTTLYRY